jgi:hypothetical protein
VGAGFCALAALSSWVLSRGRRTIEPGAMSDSERERLMLEEAELATAGLVGIEAEQSR